LEVRGGISTMSLLGLVLLILAIAGVSVFLISKRRKAAA